MRSLRFVSVALLLVSPAFAVERPVLEFQSPGLARDARLVPVGGSLLVEAVPLGGAAGPATFELERFEIFARDSRIVVQGDDGVRELAPPKNAYFRGHVAGDPASWVVLTVRESGGVRGLVARPGRFWVMATPAGSGSALAIREIDAATEFAERSTGFSCGTETLGDPQGKLDELFSKATGKAAASAPVAVTGVTHTARVAIETDFEYFQLFGNTQDATDYLADLFAYTSTVYESEINTSFVLGTIFLYTTASDPWSQTSTTCRLMELGNFWNVNRTAETRTITHHVSGRTPLAGIAWLGVLCANAFSVNLSQFGITCPGMATVGTYGGDYGYSGGISGSFDIGNPSVVWDLLVVSHEIGHNFNSPHTHCYGGLGGNANPVDTCYAGECGGSGCHCGATSLPCGTVGGGCGTIMSYCHLLGGGLANIAYTFGEGHPWGTTPGRVPAEMRTHVTSTAGGDPACLAFVPPANAIFEDGFEGGNTNEWTDQVP